MPRTPAFGHHPSSGEIERLRSRLAEAEEALRAIHDGELDALVVGAGGFETLLALEGPSQPYRSLIECMSEGALTLTLDGLVLYANRRLADMLEARLETVIGSEIAIHVAEESRPAFRTLLQRAAVESRREELTFVTAEGRRLPVWLSVSRLHPGELPDSLFVVATDLTAQKQTAATLAADRLEQAILEQATEAIVICEATGRVIRASKEAHELLGENLIGQRFDDAIALRKPDGAAFESISVTDGISRQSQEVSLEHAGKRFDLLVSVGHLTGARTELLGTVVTLADITERKAHEREILRLSRLYAARSQVNEAIVRLPTRDKLFTRACQILVEDGGFRMAWIGWYDPETALIVPVADWGDPDGYLRRIAVYGDLRPEGRGPTGTAFRSGRPSISNDRLTDSALQPWRLESERCGLHSSAGFAIRAKGNVCATLSVYAGEKGVFKDKEVALLREVAADLSFALDNIAREDERKWAEEANERALRRLNVAQRIGQIGDWEWDIDTQLITWSAQVFEILGRDVRLGPPKSYKDQAAIYDAASQELMNVKVNLAITSGEPQDYELEARRPDGERVTVLGRAVPRKDETGRVVGLSGTIQDVSARKRARVALQESEAELKEAQRLAGLGSWCLELDSGLLHWSEETFKIFGLDPAAPAPSYLELSELLKPDSLVEMQRAVDKTAEHGEPFAIELQGTRPDRSSFWILSRGEAVREANGGIRTLRGTALDITERKHAELTLRESKRRFTDMLGNVELVSLMLDRETQITYCNDYLLRLTGWQRDEVLGRNWIELFAPPEVAASKVQQFADLLLDRPGTRHHEDEILTRSGERRLIRWSNSVLLSESGAAMGTASIGEDITDRKAAEYQISSLNRVYAMLSAINTLIVRVQDRDELLETACQIAVTAGGFRMAMVKIVDPSTMTIVPVASAGKDEEMLSAIKALVSTRTLASTTMVGRAIREKRPVVSNDSQNDPQVLLRKKYTDAGVRSIAVLPLMVADEAIGSLALYASKTESFHEEELKLLIELAGNVAFAIDHIGKRERLDYLAYYDELTGLANRRLFLERVAQFIRSASSAGHKLAVYMLDVERFKNINDSLGQPAGDALLKQVAAWLTESTGDANLLARIGADHFAAVLPMVGQEGEVARRIERTVAALLEHPFHLGEDVFRIAVKVGVALFPNDGADADTLFRNAEAALKRAKAKGDRYLFYTQEMTNAVAGKLTMEYQLRQALDNDEFVLHYQPKKRLATNEITGVEALIRWNDPRTGLVPPGQFIPVLEETGLIHEVGLWALHKATEDYLRWRAAGLAAVRIAVNVSALQLRSRDFVAQLEQLNAQDPRVADGLELEITESVIMEDIKQNIASLRAIRVMGILVAIDDFGTGFSSLSYLSRLPVSTLKIDRSFVNDMIASSEGLALVSTIINLAHSLKLTVVAEGVETDEQARLLRLLNCDEMQGFLYSRPVPVDVLEAKFLAAPRAVGKRRSGD